MNLNYLTPMDLLAEFIRETRNVQNEILFNDPKYQKVREKWVAGMMGLALEKIGLDVEVRSLKEEANVADCEFLVGKREVRFQITEVQAPERQRGREYKERSTQPGKMFPYEPQRGMQEGPAWVAEGVKKKFDKRYSPIPHLIIYLNFDAQDIDTSEISRQCETYKGAFLSLWILQNHRVRQVWDSEQTRGWAEDWVPLVSI